MDFEDSIKLYLPQYLSEEKLKDLKRQLRDFATGHDNGKYFTTRLKNDPNLFQGDGIIAPMCNFPDLTVKEVPVLLLSNTCDMDINNNRPNSCRLMYAPILNLDKYIQSLKNRKLEETTISTHIADIKNQVVSQIFYLPTSVFWGHDSIILFDRAMSIPLTKENIFSCIKSRSFSLSNYGFYLLLLKLSYHFTRIQEKVDRSDD